ncbi:MAG: HigA family addiction module antitoxin [Gammaproteobacteria bacterium]|nr:HigA family addiction module antitoxin [Gammaproteobacteria bacterium]
MRALTMNEIASDRVGPMQNPPHLGELIRESMDHVGWNVTETAGKLGCERGTMSRLLNGKAGVSANLTLALEDIGWGTAEHWMRMQASYELAQARRDRAAAERRTGTLHA